MGKIAEFIEKRYSLADLDKDMDAMVWGRAAATGVAVSETTALKSVPYFHGVRLISETVGQVPLIYYKRVMRGREPGRRGKERAVEENLYWLLHEEPNPEMDAVAFKSALTGHAVVWGNAYAEIDWDMKTGELRALWPLNVSRMEVLRERDTGELLYRYTVPNTDRRGLKFRSSAGTRYTLPAWRVWHLAAFGFNGITGYNNVDQSREALGLTMALEEHDARFFGNGARPGVVLTHPGTLTKEAKKANIEHWQEEYGGLSNAHRVAILDEGITIKEIGIAPQLAQKLESRTFQIQEVARMLNVTPHKLMELSHATYSNIEHQDLEFLKYTMGIWFRRWEQSLNRKLILPGERRSYFYEFLEESLLRADSAARAAFYKELFYLGAVSPNDIREKENYNPIEDPGGDRYYIQANMTPMDMVDTVIMGQAREAMKPKELREMNPEDWQESYEEGTPHWAEELTPSLFAQEFVDTLKENSITGHLLEIGCGNGRDSIFFARSGYTVSAIDVAQGAIDLARENAKKAEVSIDFQKANAEDIPYVDGYFDALFSLSVLHSSDLNKSIPETVRVIRNNGMALIYIYGNTQYADGRLETVISLDDYTTLLKESGYEIIDFYAEHEEEFDEYGEKHLVFVALLRKK